MAFILEQSRLISGKGVLKVIPAQLVYRSYSLFIQVVRKPKQEYLNYNYNPPKSRYATLTFLKDNYVVKEHSVSYPLEKIYEEPDKCGQTLIAVKCAYQGLLESFVNQNLALGLIVTGVTNSIIGYTTLSLEWNEIRVVCYADTAVQLRLYAEDYLACNNSYKVPNPGAPTPASIPEVPSGTPLTGDNAPSTPYDYPTSDNGNTEPYPGDEIEVPPEYQDCAAVVVTYAWQISGFPPGQSIARVFAPVGGLRIKPTDPTGVECLCKGVVPGVCQPSQAWVAVNSFAANIISLTVVSIVAE